MQASHQRRANATTNQPHQNQRRTNANHHHASEQTLAIHQRRANADHPHHHRQHGHHRQEPHTIEDKTRTTTKRGQEGPTKPSTRAGQTPGNARQGKQEGDHREHRQPKKKKAKKRKKRKKEEKKKEEEEEEEATDPLHHELKVRGELYDQNGRPHALIQTLCYLLHLIGSLQNALQYLQLEEPIESYRNLKPNKFYYRNLNSTKFHRIFLSFSLCPCSVPV